MVPISLNQDKRRQLLDYFEMYFAIFKILITKSNFPAMPMHTIVLLKTGPLGSIYTFLGPALPFPNCMTQGKLIKHASPSFLSVTWEFIQTFSKYLSIDYNVLY